MNTSNYEKKLRETIDLNKEFEEYASFEGNDGISKIEYEIFQTIYNYNHVYTADSPEYDEETAKKVRESYDNFVNDIIEHRLWNPSLPGRHIYDRHGNLSRRITQNFLMEHAENIRKIRQFLNRCTYESDWWKECGLYDPKLSNAMRYLDLEVSIAKDYIYPQDQLTVEEIEELTKDDLEMRELIYQYLPYKN